MECVCKNSIWTPFTLWSPGAKGWKVPSPTTFRRKINPWFYICTLSPDGNLSGVHPAPLVTQAILSTRWLILLVWIDLQSVVDPSWREWAQFRSTRVRGWEQGRESTERKMGLRWQKTTWPTWNALLRNLTQFTPRGSTFKGEHGRWQQQQHKDTREIPTTPDKHKYRGNES